MCSALSGSSWRSGHLAERHGRIERRVRAYRDLLAWIAENEGVLPDEDVIARIRDVTGWGETEATALLAHEVSKKREGAGEPVELDA